MGLPELRLCGSGWRPVRAVGSSGVSHMGSYTIKQVSDVM